MFSFLCLLSQEHICADESGHFCVKKLVLQDKNRPGKMVDPAYRV